MYKRAAIVMILFLSVFFCAFSEENKKENLKTILNLTSQQEEEFAKLKRISCSRDSVCFVKLEKLRGKLFDELSKEKINQESINEISREIGEVHSELSLCMSTNINEMKKILTPAQFERFMEFNKNKTYRGFAQKRCQ